MRSQVWLMATPMFIASKQGIEILFSLEFCQNITTDISRAKVLEVLIFIKKYTVSWTLIALIQISVEPAVTKNCVASVTYFCHWWTQGVEWEAFHKGWTICWRLPIGQLVHLPQVLLLSNVNHTHFISLIGLFFNYCKLQCKKKINTSKVYNPEPNSL